MSEHTNQDPFDEDPTRLVSDQDFLVVGLGASAGGIQALREFFAHVPADGRMAYVVVLHLSPDHDSQLASVLQAVAPIPVTQVEDRVAVEPDHVYVIPPNKSLKSEGGVLALSEVTSVEVRRAPVDIFFRALAESHGARAVSVVLSGTGANGSMGMKRVKEMGGLCIVQDPAEAEYEDMPRHSLATGLVDYVLPAAQMPAQIIAYREQLRRLDLLPSGAEQAEEEANALVDVLTQLRVSTGHDFTNYKRPTLLRRVARRMGVNQLRSLAGYAQFMREHPQEAGSLLTDMLISVTNFFRDREAFDALEQRVVQQLFAGGGGGGQVRAWAAGCATGEEAYSLAMILVDHAERLPVPPLIQVFATDIDEAALTRAREGYYTLNDVADVPPERLRRYFVSEGDNGFRVRREVRELVLFASHNLIKDPPFAHLDLVTCRNLLIYLNRAAQRRVMDALHFALKPGGHLMLGASETVDGAADLFTVVDKARRIYQGRAVEKRYVFPPADGAAGRRLEKLPEARRAGAGPRVAGSYALLHQQLLELYAPPSVVVNEEHEVLHLSEEAGQFMQPRGGEMSAGLLQLVRPELRLELRAALYKAAHTRGEALARPVTLTLGAETKTVRVRVRPSPTENGRASGFFLVLFGDETPAPPEEAAEREPGDDRGLAHRLEEELLEVKAQLSAAVEQHEIQREELKASNEELQGMNEELETSKEELQSINEELTIVNQELRVKIEELSRANDDFKNLINSTQIGTVFLDRGLRVMLFTPRARDVFNLIPADLGRRLSDITSRLVDGGHLITDAETVLDRLQPLERRVETTDGRVFLMQIQPYRSLDDRINGVVLTFLDMTAHDRAEAALRRSEEQFRRAVEEAPIPVIMHAEDGEVLQVSRTWTELTGYTTSDVPTFEAWLTRAYGEGARAVRAHMQELFEGDRRVLDMEFPVRTRGGDLRHWSFSASSPGTLQDGRRFIVGMAVDVTERKLAEAALAESGAAASDLAPDLLWSIDPSGSAEWFNRRWLEYTGQTRDALSGSGWLQSVHPEDRDPVLRGLRKALSGGEPYRQEQRVRSAAGEYRWFLAQARPASDDDGRIVRWFGAAADVHEERATRERLRASEERLQRMMEGISDYAIIMLDEEGYIESWNVGAERIFGFTESEAVGKHTEIIFTREDRRTGVPLDEMRRAREHGRATDERWHVRKDGSRAFLSGVLSPNGDSTPAGYVKIARDLTSEKRAEEELRLAHLELEDRVRERTLELAETNVALREEISERVRAERSRVRLLRQIVRAQEDERRRIASDIHDQLGQQMTALRLSLDALQQGCGDDPQTRTRLKHAQALAERLDADVDFLAWELRPAVLDDLGLLAAIGNFVGEWSRHTGIPAEFHTSGLEKERLALEAESALYRITQEALNNAMKYARPSRVDVLLERRGEQVVLIVEDDGVGFVPLRDEAEGKGLGIIGMRERATLVGGSLEIESKPGEGTAVFARVPFRFLEEEPEE